MIAKFLTRLFRPRKLTEVEARVLEEVASALPESQGAIVRAHQRLIARVYRIDQGREADFYYDAPPTPVFEMANDEVELARVTLSSLDSGHGAHASVYLVKGKLFSIQFDAPPGDLRGETLKVRVELNNNGQWSPSDGAGPG